MRNNTVYNRRTAAIGVAMSNRIAEEIKKQGFNKHSFSAKCGVPYGTLYRICKDGASMDSITIDNFLKIAHGLGMTAEELYYGTKEDGCECSDRDEPSITADEQTIVDGYRIADVRQKRHMLSTARLELEMAEEDAREKRVI
jgi:transcriptional regulator with XRE-family HTH domain